MASSSISSSLPCSLEEVCFYWRPSLLPRLPLGIPLLYLLTAISFKLQFMVEKAELLRLSQRPPSFGRDLARMVGWLLPYATLLHCGFSAWAFSFQKTSRSPLVTQSAEEWAEWIEIVIGYITKGGDKNRKQQARRFGARLMQATSAHHVILFLIFACILLARVSGSHTSLFLKRHVTQLTMSIWVAAVKKMCSFLGVIKDTGLLNCDSRRLPDISSAISSGLLIGPTSYSLRSNPKYLGALPTKTWTTEDTELLSSPISVTQDETPFLIEHRSPSCESGSDSA